MNSPSASGPSNRDWANANLTLDKVEFADDGETIFQLRKEMVINGVVHVQYVWMNRLQLRSVAIDHAL